MTLEDEAGNVNLIIWPALLEQQRQNCVEYQVARRVWHMAARRRRAAFGGETLGGYDAHAG